MLVCTFSTQYPDTTTGEFIDVPAIPFINSTYPLYIGVREGQVKRVQKRIEREKLGGVSLGYWELHHGEGKAYLTRQGKLNWDLLKKHDVIIFSDSDRIDPKHTDLYKELISTVSAKLCKSC